MGDFLRRFDNEAKLGGDLLGPILEHAFLRETIKRVVDLYGWQLGGVKTQHLLGGEPPGIKFSHPRFVAVAAGADPEFHVILESYHFAEANITPRMAYSPERASNIAFSTMP